MPSLLARPGISWSWHDLRSEFAGAGNYIHPCSDEAGRPPSNRLSWQQQASRRTSTFFAHRCLEPQIGQTSPTRMIESLKSRIRVRDVLNAVHRLFLKPANDAPI